MKTTRIYKVLAALLILGIIGFTSCKKEEVVKVFGYVQGFVYDGTNNTAIDDVKVTWEVAGKQDSTTATAADGFHIDNLYSGEYYILFSKAGYSTVMEDLYVPMDDFAATAKGGADKEYMVSMYPTMYPMNAEVTGRVYKNENSIYIPIEGAVVRLELPYDNIIPRVYETTTDADGYYTFSNIPAVSWTYLRVLEYTDANGEKYNDYYNDYDIVAGATTTINPINLSRITDNLKLINTNLWTAPDVPTNNFPINGSITLEFNKDVDQSVTEERGGYVNLYGAGTYKVVYNGNIITITPDVNFSTSSNYSVEFEVYNKLAYEYTYKNIPFSTAAAK